VLRKRPYIQREWCAEVIARPVRRIVQANGRIRHWAWVDYPSRAERHALRVITLEDGETVHNAFFDRDFREDRR